MTREDLLALRLPLAVFAATFLVAIAVVLFSGAVLDRARETRTQREAQLRDARLRSQNAGGEKQRIVQ